MSSLWHKAIIPVLSHFRQRRGQALAKRLPDLGNMQILDFGGSVHFWFESGLADRVGKVSIYNISEGEVNIANVRSEKFEFHLFDGFHVPVPDRHFDLVVCNSVLEHVPPAARAAVAQELRRVSKRGHVQTPAHEFPVEPHFIMPFMHWFPRALGRSIVRFTPWALLSRASASLRDSYFDEIRLLRGQEVRALFPECDVAPERFLGLRKSWVVSW